MARKLPLYLLTLVLASAAGIEARQQIGTPIEINVPAQTGIEISHVKLNSTPTEFRGGSFTITNRNHSDLIAFSVSVDLYFDTAPDRPIHTGTTSDGWFLNQSILKPGESQTTQLQLSVTSKVPARLTHVTITPDYVEFSGGDVRGENPRIFGAALKKSRDSEAALLRSYCGKFESGEPANTVAALIQSDARNARPTDREQQSARSTLSSFLDANGPQGFANVCLAPPASRAY